MRGEQLLLHLILSVIFLKAKSSKTSKSSKSKKSKKADNPISYFFSLFGEKGNFMKHHFKFKGNPWGVLSFFIIGILVPPLMAFAVIYFIQRNWRVVPRLLGRYLWIYSIVVALHLFFSAVLTSKHLDIFMPQFYKYFLAALTFYLFIFAWLWYDNKYSK